MSESIRLTFKTLPSGTEWETLLAWWLEAEEIEALDGGPPITIGGQGEKRTLRIAARFADDWNFPGGTPEQFAHKIEVLHGHCADVGREPSEITCSTHVIAAADPNQTAENAAAFVEAGAAHLCLYFFDLSNRDSLASTVEAVSGILGH